MKFFAVIGLLLIGAITQPAFANNLAKNVICYGEDNFSVELSANEEWMKAVIEGEGGWTRVFKKQPGSNGGMVYVSSQGVLVLKKGQSSFKWHGDSQPQSIRCETSSLK